MVLTHFQDMEAPDSPAPDERTTGVRKQVTQRTQRQQPIAARRDAGHTGIEFVAVLGVVGVLASFVALMITGMRTEAAETACVADAQALNQAAEHYLAITGNTTIPAAGTDADRFEITLVDAGYLHTASLTLDLDARGAVVTPEGSSC